jgi:NADH-quinone oxidoreductase subunit A
MTAATSTLGQYLPIVLLAGLGVVFAAASLAASALLRPHKPTPAKVSPYECGIVPERVRKGERFPVNFYLVAMLFIVFDIETIFLFPWAVEFRSLGLFGLVEMVVFIALVLVAYVYVWKSGGLDWATHRPRESGAPAPPGVERPREVVGAR